MNFFFVFAILFSLVAAVVQAGHLKPRQKAPLFKTKAVIDDKFIDVSLSEYISASKWTVLLFYPFDFTFVSINTGLIHVLDKNIIKY